MGSRLDKLSLKRESKRESFNSILSVAAIILSVVGFIIDRSDYKEELDLYTHYLYMDNEITLDERDRYAITAKVGANNTTSIGKIPFVDLNIKIVVTNKSSRPTSITNICISAENDYALKIGEFNNIIPNVKKVSVNDKDIDINIFTDIVFLSEAIKIEENESKILTITIQYPITNMKVVNDINKKLKVGEKINSKELKQILSSNGVTLFGKIPIINDRDPSDGITAYKLPTPKFEIKLTTNSKETYINDKEESYFDFTQTG